MNIGSVDEDEIYKRTKKNHPYLYTQIGIEHVMRLNAFERFIEDHIDKHWVWGKSDKKHTPIGLIL